MPRKLTKDAPASVQRKLDRHLRFEFQLAMKYLSPFDKKLLLEILERHLDGQGTCLAVPELKLASAFETAIDESCDDLLVIRAEDYERLLKRLDEAEAFRKKVTVMPEREVA